MIILNIIGKLQVEEPVGITIVDAPIILLIVLLVLIVFFFIKHRKSKAKLTILDTNKPDENSDELVEKDILMQPKKSNNLEGKLPFTNFSPIFGFLMLLISFFLLLFIGLTFG